MVKKETGRINIYIALFLLCANFFENKIQMRWSMLDSSTMVSSVFEMAVSVIIGYLFVSYY